MIYLNLRDMPDLNRRAISQINPKDSLHKTLKKCLKDEKIQEQPWAELGQVQ